MMSFITFVAFFIVVIAARDTFRATGTASVPETDDEVNGFKLARSNWFRFGCMCNLKVI